MKKVTAALFGIAIASLVTSVVLSVMTPIHNGRPTFGSAIGLIPVAFFFVFPVSLLAGGPMIFFLNKFGRVNVWTSTVGGALVGVVATLILVNSSANLSGYAGNALIGAISGFFFWIVWRSVTKVNVSHS